MRKRCPGICSQEQRLKDVAGRLDHLPLGVRLFCEWSQARYCRDMKPMDSARKAFISTAKSAAKACGAAFDEPSATATFLLQYLDQPGACDETAIMQRIFDDWTSNADVSDSELMQSNEKYPRGLIGTVRLALHELHRLDADDAACSRQLLSILALCPPTNTPWSLLLGHDGVCVSGLDVVTRREGLARIAALLQRSGLVQVEGERFSMHQLLQRAVRREVAGGADAAVRLIDARVGGEDLKAADVYREMLPAAYHVVKEVALAEAARSEWCRGVRKRIAALMDWLGGGALEVEIRRAILQEISADGDDPEYATSLIGVAAALSSQGRHAEALDLNEQALAFRRRVLPADHPHIAMAMHNTAASYSALGRHAEALDLQEQTLAFLRRMLPADHPDIAAAMNNMEQRRIACDECHEHQTPRTLVVTVL
jgi:hypothetical protein